MATYFRQDFKLQHGEKIFEKNWNPGDLELGEGKKKVKTHSRENQV